MTLEQECASTTCTCTGYVVFQTGGVCFQDPDDFEIQQVLDYDVDVVSL